MSLPTAMSCDYLLRANPVSRAGKLVTLSTAWQAVVPSKQDRINSKKQLRLFY